MKHTLLSIIIIFGPLLTHAQSNWSFGARSGVELIKSPLFYPVATKPLFDNQLFLTKRIVGNLEVEVNCSYSSQLNYSYGGVVYDSYEYYSQHTTINYLQVGIAARYFIIKTRTIAPYIIISANSVTTFTNTSFFSLEQYTRLPNEGNETSVHTNYLHLYAFGVGANKEITRHWNINTQCVVNYDYPGSTFSLSNHFTPKFQIGLAYCWQ